jgi:tetratricopeptide (TPR) repeat protein
MMDVMSDDNQLHDRPGDDLAAPDVPQLLQELLARYQRDYDRDRPGLVGEALGLIWAARRGLSETELLCLLNPAELTELPIAAWLPLRAALEKENLLLDRDSILNFAHDTVRSAIESAFVPDEDRRDELRLQLADYFERQPISSRSCDELPWLLFQTESYQRLRECLLDVDRFLEINKRDQGELRRYWVDLEEETKMGALYLASFERWSQLPHRDESQISYAANELALFLNRAGLYADAEPLVRCSLAIDERTYGPEHIAVARDLNNLAVLLEYADRLDEAEPLYRRAQVLFEKNLGGDHPDVGTSLNNLAQVLKKMNKLDEAEPIQLRAVQIFLRFTRVTNHLDPRLQMAITNYGRLLQAMGRSMEQIDAAFSQIAPDLYRPMNQASS